MSPVFGIIYNIVDPQAFDPLWARFGLAGLTLAVLALSYVNDWVETRFIAFAQGLFYVSTAYFVGLTYLNGFEPDYALGAFLSISGFGVGLSLGSERVRPLVVYLVAATLMCVVGVLWVPRPQVNPAIMTLSVVSVSMVIFAVAQAKIQAEAMAVSSEKRYQYVHTLINAANDAIFIIDPQSKQLVEVNQKAQALVGRPRRELLGMPLSELYPAEDRDRFTSLLQEHVRGERSGTESLCVVGADDRRIPVDVSANRIDVNGTSLIQGIFRDATERREYERQLIEAKEQAEELLQLKTSFLNNMSHELRTPLTSILGYAEVLHEEEAEGLQREFAERIVNSAKRLQETLNSVLDLAQLESGAAQLDLERLDLAREVEDVVDLLQPIAEKKGLSLSTVISADDSHALVDAACINRITNNLVGNAIKFTDEGHVTVEVGATKETVFLRVKDTGIGIEQDFLDHLFDEFRQESTGLQRTHEGNGLGLAITKRLVDLMNGTIEVVSEKGVGSIFTVHLPRTETASPEDAQHPEEALLSNELTFQGSILIVEDNALTRELIVHHLDAACDVSVVETAETALDLARTRTFDLVMLDIHLGADVNGLDVLHALRALNGYEDVPAIALTAYALPADREQFLEAGFDYHLSKPFTKEQLYAAVHEAWGPHSALSSSS